MTATPLPTPLPTPLLDHGVIGNGRILALVAPSTHIDWLCMPNFDSPSVFARLLDTDKGGSFSFVATGEVTTVMHYVINTNVLRTRVTAADGSFDIYDYAPRVPAGLGVEAPIEIHRVLIPREGEPQVVLSALLSPRPPTGRPERSEGSPPPALPTAEILRCAQDDS